MSANKTKRNMTWLVPALLLAGVGTWFVVQQRASVPAIRHVVLISLDTCRADHLSCYGYAQPTTPNIDALAGQGYQFNHAVTPIPLTLPAHASMLTGTIPPHHGKHENKDVYFDPSHVTLAALLRTKGYRTGAFVGSQVLNGRFGLDRGFDTYDDRFVEQGRAGSSERSAEAVNRAAFAWLDKQTDDPVFLFLHYYDPHDAYEPPEPFATTFQENPYAGEIAYTDHCIGEVVAKLKSLDMYDSSLIIVTADHGEMLGEHGETTHMYFIYQSAIKVPLIFKLPGSGAGRKIDDLASIIDIVPTVCDLLSIDPPSGIQGENLTPYLGSRTPQSVDRYLYCESLHPTKYEANSLLGLVSRQWKYIQTTRPELYDLQKDPEEQTNLVEAHAQQARSLKEHLSHVLEQTVRTGEGQADAPLDEELLQHLRSLGYVGGSGVAEDFSFDQSKRDPKDLIAFHNEYREAMHLIEQNRLTEARALGEQLITQHADIPRLYESLSGVALNQKDYAAAIRHGEKALALKPGRMEVHYNLGVAYSASAQHGAAIRQFERVLALMPEAQTALQAKRVQVHNQLGLSYARQKQYDQAIVQLGKSLRLNPKQPRMLNTLAWTLVNCPDHALRDPARALALARQACALTQSRHPVYLNTLAAVYEALNQLGEAVTTSERALTLAQAKGDQALVTRLQTQLDLLRKAMADAK